MRRKTMSRETKMSSLSPTTKVPSRVFRDVCFAHTIHFASGPGTCEVRDADDPPAPRETEPLADWAQRAVRDLAARIDLDSCPGAVFHTVKAILISHSPSGEREIAILAVKTIYEAHEARRHLTNRAPR